MDYLQKFNEIMVESPYVAIANLKDNQPDIRFVSHYYDPEKKGVLYFASFKGTPKTIEFSKNNKVAFSVQSDTDAVRVTNAIVKKSELTAHDLKNEFIDKFPGYKATYERSAEMQDIYEIHFNEAIVVVHFHDTCKIIL